MECNESDQKEHCAYLEAPDIVTHSELEAVTVVAGPLGLQSEWALLGKEDVAGGWWKERRMEGGREGGGQEGGGSEES